MIESFVMYRSFHEALKKLSREEYGNVMYAINEYALYGIDPEGLSPVEDAIFTMAKPQLDANTRRKECGAAGGRPKTSTENKKPMVIENNENEKPMVIENAENKKPNENENVNVNDNVNENENENTENPAHSPSLPPQSYADAVFDIFQEAGLPCCNKNKLTFWQRDFKNALEYIHNAPDLRGLHSDAIIGACCNYVRTINDPQSYLKNKYSFDRLVKTKNFKDFLPDNYVPDNFKRWDTKDEVPKEKPIAPAADPFAFVPDTPTVCLCGGKLTRENHGAGLLYVKCKTCGRWAEHDPLKDGWEWSDAG